MALFEFTDGQFKPAQLGKPVDSDTLRAMLRAIRIHVLELLPRPLFPVAWLSGENEPPRLIAVDASGQVVCVYVVEHLGSDQMVNVLAKLNEARRLGWNELSELYEGGQAAFRAGVTSFRSSIPNGTPSGPRLIAVAGSVEENLRSAIEVLATSGIEVHEFSLRELPNGRKILQLQSISPLIRGLEQQLTGKTHRPLPIRSRYTQKLDRVETYPQINQIIPVESSPSEEVSSPKPAADTTKPKSSPIAVSTAFDKRHANHQPVARPRIMPTRRKANTTLTNPPAPAMEQSQNPVVIQPQIDETDLTQRRTLRGEVLNTRGRIPSRRDLKHNSEPVPETTRIAIPRLGDTSPHYTPHGTLIPSRRRQH